MATENREIRRLALSDVRALDTTGDNVRGGFAAYPCKWYTLTCYNSILLPGCTLESIPAFLKSGFVSQSHEWDAKEVVGYATVAREDEIGFYSEAVFHSTDHAQDIRTIVTERMAAGKECPLSIGFCALSEIYISSDAYATELPKYIPGDKLAALMAQISSLSGVWLIPKIQLFEYSVVTVPGLPGSGITSSFSNPADAGRDRLPFAEELQAALDAVTRLTGVASRQQDIVKLRGAKHSAATIDKIGKIKQAAQDVSDLCDGMLNDGIDEDDEPDDDEMAAKVDAALLDQRLRFEARRVRRLAA